MDWFRDNQKQRSVSLNLEKRREQRTRDRDFREKMNAVEDRLARNDEFPYREVNLDSVEEDEPAYPPEPDLPDPRDLNDPGARNDGGDDSDTEDRQRLDIHLRETLRVLNDLIVIQKDQEAVASAG